MELIGYVLSSAAGLTMVIGCLFLLWNGRIVLDTKGKSMSYFELPGGLKFGTQFPVLVMFFLGGVLLVYPVYQAKNICGDRSLHDLRIPEIVTITGQVKTQEPIDLYAIVGEQKRAINNITLKVPYVSDRPYYIFRSDANGGFYAMDSITLPDTKPPHSKEYSLERTLEVPTSATTSTMIDFSQPAKTASQDELANFKRPEVQK